MTARPRPGTVARAGLVLRIWMTYVGVLMVVRRNPLPEVVRGASRPRGAARSPFAPWLLSRAVDRALRVGSVRPRCLINALVLYRLLHEQGDAAELVIGLPRDATDQLAHAWIELDGRDIGPPPGSNGHQEMARFGA